MDDELKAFLEAMRQENVAAHAETRAALDAAQSQNAAEFAAVRQENAAAHAETRRHFDVSTEELRHELQIVAEGVVMNGEKLDHLDAKYGAITSDLDTRVTRLEATSSRMR